MVGEIPVPAIVGVALGTASGVSGVVVLVVGLLVTVVTTTSVAVLESGSAPPAAVAVAVNSSFSPAGAWACTGTCASSSSAWPTGRSPIAQAVPFADGQTLNNSVPMFFVVDGNFTETTALVLAACVLQTQMTKLAVLPGAT